MYIYIYIYIINLDDPFIPLENAVGGYLEGLGQQCQYTFLIIPILTDDSTTVKVTNWFSPKVWTQLQKPRVFLSRFRAALWVWRCSDDNAALCKLSKVAGHPVQRLQF